MTRRRRQAEVDDQTGMFLFDFYRRLLMIACAVYGAVRLGQGLLRWADRLAGRQKYRKVVRGYIAAILVSTRVRMFWPELAHILVLLLALGVVLYAHRYVM